MVDCGLSFILIFFALRKGHQQNIWGTSSQTDGFNCLHKGHGRMWHFCERLVCAESLSVTEEAKCLFCKKTPSPGGSGLYFQQNHMQMEQPKGDSGI